jgi:hypothetical protein
MRSISDFPEDYELWADSDTDIAADIKSILDWCPGEIRSRQIERIEPSYESTELKLETKRRKSLRQA